MYLYTLYTNIDSCTASFAEQLVLKQIGSGSWIQVDIRTVFWIRVRWFHTCMYIRNFSSDFCQNVTVIKLIRSFSPYWFEFSLWYPASNCLKIEKRISRYTTQHLRSLSIHWVIESIIVLGYFWPIICPLQLVQD